LDESSNLFPDINMKYDVRVRVHSCSPTVFKLGLSPTGFTIQNGSNAGDDIGDRIQRPSIIKLSHSMKTQFDEKRPRFRVRPLLA